MKILRITIVILLLAVGVAFAAQLTYHTTALLDALLIELDPDGDGSIADTALSVASLKTTGVIELGHATENTLSASGGVLSIEGTAVLTAETDSVVGAVNGVVCANGAGTIAACSNVADSTYLTAETDSVVGAVTGLVKADGAGNISAASAGTDYQAPVVNAAADGATKGIAAFTAADFNASSGVISIDYVNGTAATEEVKGFLAAADFSTFNAKQDAITRPVSGPASSTQGNLAVFGATNQILADGGAPFNPAVPGAIGGTTPAAGTFTTVTAGGSGGVTVTKDGSGNMVLTDAVSGANTLASLITGAPSNLSLDAGEFPATLDGSALVGLSLYNEVDGSTAADPSATLTAAQMTNNCVTYNTGQGAADRYVQLPTASKNLSCLFTVGTAQTNKWGVKADTNDKIYLIAAAGTVAAGSDNGYARFVNAQVGQSFACWSFKTDAYDWQCKAISIGTSTFVAE